MTSPTPQDHPGRAVTGRTGGGSDDECPHGDKPTRCPLCCLLYLRQRRADLHLAVTGPRGAGAAADFVRGGAPSWEPISIAALALLQDIARAGGLDKAEADLSRLRDPESLAELHRHLRQWRGRCSLILHEATAAYTLTWDVEQSDGAVRSQPIPCPVVSDTGECGAPLRVHRDDDPKSADFTRPYLIRCVRRDDHEWLLKHGGWLRLGVLLGGTMGETA